MNSIALTGNLTADPEVFQYTNNGQQRSAVSFRMANNERVGDQDVLNGYFDVTAFGSLAEHIHNHLKKGERVTVVGRLNHQTFEREDGSKGGRTKILAVEVGLSLNFAGASRITPPPAPTDEEEAVVTG